jgi:hypothetical protein
MRIQRWLYSLLSKRSVKGYFLKECSHSVGLDRFASLQAPPFWAGSFTPTQGHWPVFLKRLCSVFRLILDEVED